MSSSGQICTVYEFQFDPHLTHLILLSPHVSSKEATVISTINLDTGQSEVQSDGLQNVIKSLESKIR